MGLKIAFCRGIKSFQNVRPRVAIKSTGLDGGSNRIVAGFHRLGGPITGNNYLLDGISIAADSMTNRDYSEH